MLNFLPGAQSELKPRITVIGVGGAGGNAVNNMIASKLEGVEFIVANTDAQSLNQSRTERRIQLGAQATQGLGAGSRPDVGRVAAEESMDEIVAQLGQSNMVFITAGMGGGTGSGAAPVIARTARDQGILTVGVVTKPFHFEGAHRMRTAEAAIEELSQYVDTLIIIPNQNLFRIATERTTFADAFKMADDVLYSGVRGVTDLMIMPGLINLDFADIRTVMSEMGKAMMGTGEAEGEKRAIDAAEAAISNPLLDDTSMKGAKGVLINITGGLDMTLFEVDEAANRIRDEVDPEANIIFGSTFDDKLDGKIRVSVVATGIASEAAQQPKPTIISLVNATGQQGQKVTAPAQSAGTTFRPAVVANNPAQAAQPVASQPAQQQAPAQPVIRTQTAQTAQTAQAVKAVAPRPVQPQPQHAPVQAELPVAQPSSTFQTAPTFQAPPARPAQSPQAHGAQVHGAQAQNALAPNAQAPVQAPIHAESSADVHGNFIQPDMGALGDAVSAITTQATIQPHMEPPHRVEAPRPDARPQISTATDNEARRPGLFDRLIPGRRVQTTREEHRVAPPASATHAPVAPAAAAPAPQPRVGRADPVAPRTGEDYEIPAFLRRQAN